MHVCGLYVYLSLCCYLRRSNARRKMISRHPVENDPNGRDNSMVYIAGIEVIRYGYFSRVVEG